MSGNETESYLKNPLFQEAMGYFQVGKWEDGFLKLNELEKIYPTEPELRSLRQEMEVRARINEYETLETKHRKNQKLVKNGIRISVVLVIVLVGFYAISTYSGWIQGQWTKTQSDFSQTMQQAQMAIDFTNAQKLIIAGKSDEALAVFNNIKTKDPEFPGLPEAMSQAQALQDIEAQYTQAINLLQQGDSAQALSLLQDISKNMPNYRDVSLQIKKLQTDTEMTYVLQQSDQAFTDGRFEDALAGYESLRLMDSSFQTSHVEDLLFQSYLKAAQALLATPVPSLSTLKKVDDLFSKALALRPLDREALAARTQVRLVIEDSLIGDYVGKAQAALAGAPDSIEAQKIAEQYLAMALAVRPNDPSVLLQFQLAQGYIQAVSDFAGGKWDAVIEQLESIIGQQAGYANGTAIQTLYDAYIARGSDYIAAGEYTLALEDFQRSAILAQQLTDSEQLSFEAQTKIAEAQGLLNHFQEAVLIYQDALNSIGLRTVIAGLNNSLTELLASAEYSSNAGDYQSAYYAYSKLVNDKVRAYNQSLVVKVKNGDYISLLAHRYNTTVAAIMSANGLVNQPRLTPDTDLIIPTLP
jgi:tetratricopeptide (TPR) repeat protein